MTRVSWGDPGSRVFEAGVDRGVLYVGDSDGVPWTGLVSVNESSTGGEAKPFYLDGLKFANRSTPEQYGATIEAYTYPDQFAECDGSASITNGLSARQQRRKTFGLSYRTLVGNDLQGLAFGYKIHILYNASVAPSARANATLSDTIDPDNFSWAVTTRPPRMEGLRPTSHFVVESRKTPPSILAQLEDILYGSAAGPARLPTVGELRYVFESYNASSFDAGTPNEPFYATFDGGLLADAQTSTIDGGEP